MLDFDTVAGRAETIKWDGRKIRVASLASVVGFKRLAGRPRGGFSPEWGQEAVYMKPNGLLGVAHMAAIKPIRHLIVYPHMFLGWRGGGTNDDAPDDGA